jgi:hypothetical protein
MTNAEASSQVLCGGARCTSHRESIVNPRCKISGAQLCPVCVNGITDDLAAIPGLYAECGRILGGAGASGERTSAKGSAAPGLPFNATAAEARSSIMSILVSWCALVTEERQVTAPSREVGPLARFLARHAAWLSAHDAAGDASRELAKAARQARWAAHGGQVRRVRVGRCVADGCPGELIAAVHPERASTPAEIVCTSDAAHRWAGHEWLGLSRRLAARPSAAGARWLSPSAVARLWSVAPGSVYRLASERSWRRRTRSGRVYYFADDVEATMGESRVSGP